MRSTIQPSGLTSDILEQAAEWLVELRTDDSLDVRERFASWLKLSPVHVRAYMEVSEIWSDTARVVLPPELSREVLVSRLRAHENIVELREPRLTGAPPRARPSRHPILIAASVAMLALAVALFNWWRGEPESIYSTAVGEQRSLTLKDGSRIELNSRSHIRVRLSENRRDVDLVDGQALFHVAKDASRPFVVHSGTASVRAVGTAFDVYRQAQHTRVTVVEGQVEVVQRSAPEIAPLSLAAGEQGVVSADHLARSASPDVSAATAWTRQELIFNGASLAEVVEEFNRYNVRPVVIADAELRTMRISGTFSSASPGSLIRFLQAQPGLRVEEGNSQVRILRNDGR